MASTKTTLRSERGVVLTKVELTDGRGSVVSTGYSLTSSRTPQTWTYETAEEAEAGFRAELEQVQHQA